MNLKSIIALSNIIMFWEGVCFLWLRPFPTPFSSTEWFLNNGGVMMWGVIFLIAALLSVLAHRVEWHYDIIRQALLTPQNLILQLTSWMMVHKIASIWMVDVDLRNRLILGMAYIVPITVMHCYAVIRGGK